VGNGENYSKKKLFSSWLNSGAKGKMGKFKKKIRFASFKKWDEKV